MGRTVDGKPVVGGVFPFVDTIGLPLDLIVEVLQDRGYVVGWEDFTQDALAHGWTQKTVDKKIKETRELLHGN